MLLELILFKIFIFNCENLIDLFLESVSHSQDFKIFIFKQNLYLQNLYLQKLNL